MDTAKRLECTSLAEFDPGLVARFLQARVELQPPIENAHVMGSRVVVDDRQNVTTPQRDCAWPELLVFLSDRAC